MAAFQVLVSVTLLIFVTIRADEVIVKQHQDDVIRRFSIQNVAGGTHKISIQVDRESSQEFETLDFIIKQQGSTQHWHMALGEYQDANISSKTLCPRDNDTEFIDVVVPRSLYNRSEITIDQVPYNLDANKVHDATISPTQPAVFLFKLQENEDFLLHVRNVSEEVCSLISVRPVTKNCSFDSLPQEESQMIYGTFTRHQTMLQQSFILIRKRDFPMEAEAVNIFMIAKRNDDGCYANPLSRSSVDNRTVHLQFSLEKQDSMINESILSVVGFYVFGGLLAILIFKICFRFNIELDGTLMKYYSSMQNAAQLSRKISRKMKKVANKNLDSRATEQPMEMTQGSERTEDGQTADESEDPAGPEGSTSTAVACCIEPNHAPWPWQKEAKAEDEVDSVQNRTTKHPLYNQIIRSRHNTESDETDNAKKRDKECFRKIIIDKEYLRNVRKNYDELKLSDMCVYFYDKKAFGSSIYTRSTLYVWLTMLMGIFYTLPVFQLVLHYQETSLQTGNLDICYFNFQCLNPHEPFQDFGHIFSNISYIISGLFFGLVVFVRSRKYEKVCKKTRDRDPSDLRHPNNCGIPEQYGIYYAMGIALAMEGFLSGCYHICPTAKNFQFDTTFMYAIAVLVFLKVYQFRHPDITLNAHWIFLVIGIALVIEVVGYFDSSVLFWIVFSMMHLIIVSFFVFNIYTLGSARFKFSCSMFKDICVQIRTNFVSKICHKKIFPTLVVILLNIGMVAYFLWKQRPGVSRYLLLITMGNMFMYVLFYILNKLRHRYRCSDWYYHERIRKTTVLYLILAVLFMCGAVYFFRKELKNSSLSPAESRNLNAPCYLLMFDNHDLWHFCSAAGLFYFFMFLLTLEDCNTGVPRNKIPVF